MHEFLVNSKQYSNSTECSFIVYVNKCVEQVKKNVLISFSSSASQKSMCSWRMKKKKKNERQKNKQQIECETLRAK